MKYLCAFDSDSQMNDNDNDVKDCRNFFVLASKLFSFEIELQ